MIITRQFSIRSGSPDKGGSLKRELAARAKAGAIIGGVSGGIIGGFTGIGLAHHPTEAVTALGVATAAGTIVGALAAGLTALGANSRKSGAEEADMNTLLDYLYNSIEDYKRETGGYYTEVKLERYIVEDQDPNKFMVNFAYEDGNLIINLNKPTNSVIESLDESLEEMIKFNRKGDYTSQQINNGFIVYVVCPSIDAAAGIIYNTIEENHIKVNAITQKLLSKVNKKQKSFTKIGDVKKLGKYAIRLGKNAHTREEMIKAVGKTQAKAVKIGAMRPSLVKNQKAAEKLARAGLNTASKAMGGRLSSSQKKEAINEAISAGKQAAKTVMKTSGKLPKISSLL